MDRERAITNAINAAVEAFIADDPWADECFDTAREFYFAKEPVFAKDDIPTTQGDSRVL